ncbi:MAG: EamA family transporter [Spirochaetales bacterium]|nr:EamA family transporter [Spirochaetales bacterium]
MNTQPKAYAAVFLSTLIWGLSFISTKIVLETFTVFSYIFARFLLASVIFSFFLLKRGVPRLERKTVVKMLVLALLQPFGYFLFETLGLKYSGATKVSLLIALIPVVVAGTSQMILKESIRRKAAIGITCSIAGVSLLVIGGPEGLQSLSGTLKGDIFVLLAVLSGSFYMILTRDISKKLSAFYITVFQMFLGTLFFLPFFLADLPNVQWLTISPLSALGVVYNSLFGTIVAFLCYNYALSHLNASTVAVYINCIPIITALGAWFLLGEVLTPLQMVGGAAVLLSVILTTSGTKKPATPLVRS